MYVLIVCCRHSTSLLKHFVEPLVMHCPMDCSSLVSE